MCIHKIAAVCNSNDLRSSESSEMASARLSVYVTTTESQETATCLINKKVKDLSEQRRWHFPERNTCTISSTGSYSYITFPPHQSHWCACTASAWLTSGCELFILLKSIWANILIFSYSILPVRTVNATLTKFGLNICVAQLKECMRTDCSGAGVSDRCPNKVDANLICN